MFPLFPLLIFLPLTHRTGNKLSADDNNEYNGEDDDGNDNDDDDKCEVKRLLLRRSR